jgi:glycosyltransferase involved in cell wall biosynthesis
MKTLHLIWSFGHGGIENLLINIINNGNHNKKSMFLLIINDDFDKQILKQLDPDKCTQIYLHRSRSSRDIKPWVKLFRVISEIKPNIIHHHRQNSILLTFVSKLFVNHKDILTFHYLPDDQEKLKIIRLFDHVIFISKSVESQTHRIVKLKKSKNSVVYNGIPSRRRKYSARKDEDESIGIACVGRLNHLQKGQHLILNATISPHFPRNLVFKITFIGDGDSREYLESLARENKIKSRVSFVGPKSQDEISSLMQHVDIIIQPSISEGFGLSLLEAIQFNKPLVISDIPAFKEVCLPGEYPQYFKCGDADSLASVLHTVTQEILSGELSLIDGQIYDDNYSKKYSIVKTIAEYEKIYKNA